MSTAPLTEIEQELAKLPPAVLEAYREALTLVESVFGEEELTLWAKEGLAIGTQTVRSWESSVEYYRVGPQVARFLAFPSFMQWARCGTYLAQDLSGLGRGLFPGQHVPSFPICGPSTFRVGLV